jgi:hypothetical protein
MTLVHTPDQIDAIAIGQAHVRQAQVRQGALERGEGTLEVLRADGVHIHAAQGDLEQLADIGLVIHHQRYGTAHVRKSLLFVADPER